MKEIKGTIRAVRNNSEDTCLHFVLGLPAVCVLSNDGSLGGKRPLGDVKTVNK